jgi:integrase
MGIKKDGKQWLVDMRPNGVRGGRVRKRFNTKAEAERFSAWIKNKATQGEWNPAPPDNRLLSELCLIWYNSHGQHLKGGERRKSDLANICERLGEPIAAKLTPASYTKERATRIKSGITPKTCNNELGYLNAVYNELKRTGVIDYDNPLSPVRKIKIAERELSFLTSEQITKLLETIKSYNKVNPHVYQIARLCLATGARWGEAERVTAKSLVKYKVTYTDTKSGKNRTVPISPGLYDELSEHFKEYGNFTRHSLSSFSRALDRSKIELPKGQASHVLRHSFASHFIMNGGNILTLQKILGHASITMTMRYAHLAPDHLQEAVSFNPLNGQNVDKENGD